VKASAATSRIERIVPNISVSLIGLPSGRNSAWAHDVRRLGGDLSGG
jgi:hypothetical protein